MSTRIRSFTVEFKLDVIDRHAKNGRSIHKTTKEYKIDSLIMCSLQAEPRGHSVADVNLASKPAPSANRGFV